MSIYDNAGVALIPSGTKASKLYSVLPTNGDGDFTHSRGSTATRVNKYGLIESVATNVPRLDYPLIDGVVQDCPALLLEPSRYNNLARSETFDDSYWNKSTGFGTSVSANVGVSPDGSFTADKLIAGTSAGVHYFRRTGLNFANATFTFSIFAKFTDDLFEQFHFVIYDGSNHFAYFNVKDGVVGSKDSGFTTSMVNYGNGWYRCIASYQTASTSVGQIKVELGDSTSETGDGTSGMLFWGIQWELGSYQTSYIPTTSTVITRSGDVCNGSGTSEEFNDSEGVLFVEIKGFVDTDVTNRYITLSDGTISNSIAVQYRNSGELRLYNNGVVTANMIYRDAFADLTQNIKIAIKYGTSTSDYKVYINGVSKTVLSGFTATSISGLDSLNLHYAFSTLYFYGLVKQAMTFKTALTENELETLTSWESFNAMAIGQFYTIE